MTLDEARAANPHLGFALYAYDPLGAVTLEIHAAGEVFSFVGLTEAEALVAAFPAHALGTVDPVEEMFE